MIEKLTLQDDTRIVCGKDYTLALRYVQQTVNQLVDAVNELQKNATVSKMENVQDEFAEQCKWIGCVCRFWYDNPNNTVLDYLGKIQTGENGIEYYGKKTYDWFPHCEPVKPDDDIIYKGGDNE